MMMAPKTGMGTKRETSLTALKTALLKDEIVSDGSPHSLTVLPVYETDGNKTMTAVSKPVVSKRTLSWAEIASKPVNTRVGKSSLFLRNLT